jgi:hypothetical protein
MRPAIVLTPWQRLVVAHQRRMDQVRALQDASSNEPIRAHYPGRGPDPDRHQFAEPPPGWHGTGYAGTSVFREQF